MNHVRTALTIPVRLLALVFGVFFVLQGITTAGWLGIISLFAGSATPILSVLGLLLLSLGMVLLGFWLLYGGIRNFPHLTAALRTRFSRL